MAYYRKRKSSLTGLWTPVAVSSQTVDEEYLANIIGQRSTVHAADIAAVLTALPEVICDALADGFSVRLGKLGSFHLVLECENTGVDTPAKVSPKQITNVKVYFRPHRRKLWLGNGRKLQNMLVRGPIEWNELPPRPGSKASEENSVQTRVRKK